MNDLEAFRFTAPVVAAADLAGRSGATDFEFGYLHDDVPLDEAGWWAKVNYRGHRLYAEGRLPRIAADKLARQILNGGQCTHCLMLVKVGRPGDLRRGICTWWRDEDHWRRGCEQRG